MVCCDLPYGTTNVETDIVIPFDNLWNAYARITKPGSTIILFGNGIFTARLILSNPTWYKYNLVWKKSKCGSPLLAKYRPMMKHEDIVVFTNGGSKHKTFHPIMETGKPYSRTNVNIKTNNHRYGLKQVTTSNKGTRYPSSILDFPMRWRRQDQLHPMQKPVELMEYIINTYSDENDMILDNCAGSGSTLIAARNTGRYCIGIEKEEKHFNIIQKRLSNEQ